MNSLISFNIEVSNSTGENTKNTNDNNPKVIYKEYVVITPVSNLLIFNPVLFKVLLSP